MNNDINKEQNKKEFLRYRYVSRKLYSDEKNYRNFIMIVGIIIYLIGLIPSSKDEKLMAIIPIIWLVASEIFKREKSNIHIRAVEYHEYCDRRMFGLSELENLLDNRDILFQEAVEITEDEKVKESFEKMIKKEHKVSINNWYSNFSGLPLEIARIMAQDENVTWEKKQRKLYQMLLVLIAILLVTVCILVIHYTTSEMFNIIFAVPIIWEVMTLILDNCDNIKRCRLIQDKIGKSYYEIRNNRKNYNTEFIKNSGNEIQFKIYENRKDSIPVPDIIYCIFRSKLQKHSNSYMKNIKEEMVKALK
jgi:uncharacterized membrane protein YiaA